MIIFDGLSWLDITQVVSTFFFRWDLDIIPLSSDDSIWRIPGILVITEVYKEIQTANHH